MKRYIVQVTFPDYMARDDVDRVLFISGFDRRTRVFEMDVSVSDALIFTDMRMAKFAVDNAVDIMQECEFEIILTSDTKLIKDLVEL